MAEWSEGGEKVSTNSLPRAQLAGNSSPGSFEGQCPHVRDDVTYPLVSAGVPVGETHLQVYLLHMSKRERERARENPEGAFTMEFHTYANSKSPVF